MHGDNLHANINISSTIKESVLNMKIVLNRKILAKLHFHSNSILHEIYLIVCMNWSKTGFNNSNSLIFFLAYINRIPCS